MLLKPFPLSAIGLALSSQFYRVSSDRLSDAVFRASGFFSKNSVNKNSSAPCNLRIASLPPDHSWLIFVANPLAFLEKHLCFLDSIAVNVLPS